MCSNYLNFGQVSLTILFFGIINITPAFFCRWKIPIPLSSRSSNSLNHYARNGRKWSQKLYQQHTPITLNYCYVDGAIKSIIFDCLLGAFLGSQFFFFLCTLQIFQFYFKFLKSCLILKGSVEESLGFKLNNLRNRICLKLMRTKIYKI